MTAYRADCSRCVGLCCVALTLVASADFAIDKPAGEPCRHLKADHRCGIHDRLPERGFPGCVRWDCFGAGQRVTALVTDPAERLALFPVVRQLQELRCYLDEAVRRSPTAGLIVAAGRLDTVPITLDLDVAPLRAELAPLLVAASDRVRGPYARRAVRVRPGDDLRGRDLRGVSLRNALLIAVDLTGADLRDADLLGADVRDARVGGADLSSTLFLSQTQVNGMHGDAATRLPPTVDRPAGWSRA